MKRDLLKMTELKSIVTDHAIERALKAEAKLEKAKDLIQRWFDEEISAFDVMDAMIIDLEFDIRYDDVYDILYLTIGDPKAGYNEPLDSRFHLRIDPENEEVIGLTVFGYKSAIRDYLTEMSKTFPFCVD